MHDVFSVHPRRLRILAMALAWVLAVGCYQPHVLPAEVPPVGARASATIGLEGGTLEVGDLRVVIPRGALATPTAISLVVDAPTDVGSVRALSPIVRFEPEGLVLATPAELRIPFAGEAPALAAYVARRDGGAFAPRPTDIEGDVALVRTEYLQSTFVGSACEGDACRCEPASTLDLLVVVDNSNSMAEEQALLAAELPRLFRALATGDLDADGAQDVPAFSRVRVGISSTDIGVGPGLSILTCEAPRGDDGVLLPGPGPGADPTCARVDDARGFASFDAASPADLDAFVSRVACASSLGVGGCGFEQPLEAALLALSPSAPTASTAASWSPPAFSFGRVAQGDAANAGFLEEDALLAVLFLTDEDDCSVEDPALFSWSDPPYASVDLNLRCVSFDGGGLFDVGRYVEGLTGLRPRPSDLVVAAVAGVPTGLAVDDLSGVLADPAMEIRVDPTMPGGIVPACRTEAGAAFPAVRMVRALSGLRDAGARTVLQSICEPRFDGVIDGLSRALAARAAGGC